MTDANEVADALRALDAVNQGVDFLSRQYHYRLALGFVFGHGDSLSGIAI
jgi:hypothetical protein